MKALFRLRQFSMCCRRLDVDKSGVIDASELRRGLRAVGCENPTDFWDGFLRESKSRFTVWRWDSEVIRSGGQKDVVFPRFCDDFPWKSVSTSLSLHFFGMAGASPPVFVDRNPLILLLDVQLSNHFDAIFLQ